MAKKIKQEHVKIMEKYLKRELERGEIVHHINGNHLDNRVENLQLIKSGAEHTALHAEANKLTMQKLLSEFKELKIIVSELNQIAEKLRYRDDNHNPV